jgi:hypothetical protein
LIAKLLSLLKLLRRHTFQELTDVEPASEPAPVTIAIAATAASSAETAAAFPAAKPLHSLRLAVAGIFVVILGKGGCWRRAKNQRHGREAGDHESKAADRAPAGPIDELIRHGEKVPSRGS